MNQIQQGYETPASEATLQQVADRIRARNIEVVIVNNGEEARQIVLERIPKGAEVHSGKSKTLQDSGIFDALQDPSQFNALRHQMLKMDSMHCGIKCSKWIARLRAKRFGNSFRLLILCWAAFKRLQKMVF